MKPHLEVEKLDAWRVHGGAKTTAVAVATARIFGPNTPARRQFFNLMECGVTVFVP